MAQTDSTLRGIPGIRTFFRTNRTPVYAIAPTPLSLLGLDRWVRSFFYVNHFDSFDGAHPRVFVPKDRAQRRFRSTQDICNHLLGHQEVLDYIRRRGPGGRGVFVMFDEETERLATEAGLQVAHPPAELRHRLESEIVTTQLADEAGVPTAPSAGREVEVARRVDVRAATVEAALTRHGTVVGPLMTDVTGHPELTPHRGGWCGNEIFPEALAPEQLERARLLTQKLGDRLAREGYRGFLEIDYLADADTGELYLGGLSPRIGGATSMSNVTAGAYADVPLLLFHLLEHMDVEYELDVEEINARWAQASSSDVWSLLIVKDTGDDVQKLTRAPKTGIWRMDDETRAIALSRWAGDWHSIRDEAEAFWLRVLGPGDHRYPGVDLGVLVTRSRMQAGDGRLTPRASDWIAGLREQFAGDTLPDEETPAPAGAPA